MNAIQKAIGRVHAVSMGARHSAPKKSVGRAYLRENHGVEGDCHAGDGARQVSLLAWEDIVTLHHAGITARPGDFAENIITEGIKLSEIAVGTTLKVGDALLRITEVGKSEWKEGDYSFKGVALVARSGLFARVIKSGWIQTSDRIMVGG